MFKYKFSFASDKKLSVKCLEAEKEYKRSFQRKVFS